MAIIIPIIAKFVDDGISDAKKAIGDADGKMGKLAATTNALAKPARAAAVSLAGVGLAAAKNAGGAIKSNAKLAASFKAVGYEKNAQAAMDYADSLQHVIGVNDEEIQAVMQKLAAFEDVAASQDLMARATLSAADMSAAGFGTMESAATALGKALAAPEKNLGALTRMGVVFTKEQREQIKVWEETGQTAKSQALIMKEVEGTFGGVAEASASGTNKMKIAWDEAIETLGTSLIPILGLLNVALTKVAAFVGENSDAILKAGAAFMAFALAINVVNVAFKVYQATMKVATVVTKVFGITMKAAMGWIGLLVGAIVVAAVLIIKNWDKVKDVTISVWNAIKGALQKTWNWIKNVAKATFDFVKRIVDIAWRTIKIIVSLNPFVLILKHCDRLREWIKSAFDWAWDKIKGIWDKIKSLFQGNPFSGIQSALSAIKDWFGNTFDWIWSKVDSVLSKIENALSTVEGWVSKVNSMLSKIKIPDLPGGKSGPSAATAALPVSQSLTRGVPATQAATAPTGGGGVTININGALDPEAVGRQVRRLLDSHDRRNGRAVVRAVAF